MPSIKAELGRGLMLEILLPTQASFEAERSNLTEKEELEREEACTRSRVKLRVYEKQLQRIEEQVNKLSSNLQFCAPGSRPRRSEISTLT